MEFKELISPTLTDLFVKEIETNIISGKLAIGERMPNERDLAANMKVSRAVINGGITRLANKGFVEVVPRKGVYVANYKKYGRMEVLQAIYEYSGGQYDPELLDDIYEMRLCFERDFVRLAALNRTDSDVEEMRAQLKKVEELTDMDELAEAAFEYNVIVSMASGNVIHPLNLQSSRPLYLPLHRAVFAKVDAGQWAAAAGRIVDAIERQDPQEAVERSTEYILWGRSIIDANYLPGHRFA